MSVKIDLLPEYVGLNRKFNLLWKLALGSAVLLGAVLFLIYQDRENVLAKTLKDYENLAANEKITTDAEAARDANIRDAKPVEDAVVFMVRAGKTGAERAALIDSVRRFIYGGSVISSLDLSDGTTLKLTASVRDPNEYSQFLLALRNGSAANGGWVFANDPRTNAVVPSGIPGGPNGEFVLPDPSTEPVIIRYPIQVNVNAALKDPVQIPVEPGGVAPAGGVPGGGPPQGR
jgi:hypothetical protein